MGLMGASLGKLDILFEARKVFARVNTTWKNKCYLSKDPRYSHRHCWSLRESPISEQKCWLQLFFKGVWVSNRPDSKLSQGILEAWEYFKCHLWSVWHSCTISGAVAQGDALSFLGPRHRKPYKVPQAENGEDVLKSRGHRTAGKKSRGYVATCSLEGLCPSHHRGTALCR